ncbi:MAG: hypothetical protein AB7E47_03380 [Desulfovibrionaceae bacterium]
MTGSTQQTVGIIIAVVALVFFAGREVFCWYTKQTLIAQKLDAILEALKGQPNTAVNAGQEPRQE